MVPVTRSVGRLALVMLVALTAGCHPVSLAAPQTAASNDLDLQISATISRLRVLELAMSTNSGLHESDYAHTRDVLIKLGQINTQATLRVIAGLSGLQHLGQDWRNEELFEQLCNASDPALVWPCLHAQSRLTPAALPRLYALPVLSYHDAADLAELDVDGLLPGLLCGGVSTWAAMLDTLDVRATSPIDPVVAGLYERLSHKAPAASRLCFLEQAARACLSLARDHRGCNAPYSVGDYFVIAADRGHALISELYRAGSNDREVYGYLYRAYPEIVFHLHLALAELLEGNARHDELSRVFHVEVAFRLWSVVNRDPLIAFAEMLSSSLRQYVCSGGCQSMCAARAGSKREYRDCIDGCETETEVCYPSYRWPQVVSTQRLVLAGRVASSGSVQVVQGEPDGALRIASLAASASGVAVTGVGVYGLLANAKNERLYYGVLLGGALLTTTGVVLYVMSQPGKSDYAKRLVTLAPTATGLTFAVAGRF